MKDPEIKNIAVPSPDKPPMPLDDNNLLAPVDTSKTASMKDPEKVHMVDNAVATLNDNNFQAIVSHESHEKRKRNHAGGTFWNLLTQENLNELPQWMSDYQVGLTDNDFQHIRQWVADDSYCHYVDLTVSYDTNTAYLRVNSYPYPK
jgi:hypothetical protein